MLKKLLPCLLALLLLTGLSAAEDAPVRLFIAPHPGDEVLGFAGTMMTAHLAGDDVHVVYLTAGSEETSAAALTQLGMDTACATHLTLEPDALTQAYLSGEDGGLGEIIAALQPTDIHLPSRYDADADSAAAYRMVLRAIEAVGGDYAPTLHETILRGYDTRKWPLRLRRTAHQKLPIAQPFTDPFPKAGMPLKWKEAELVTLTPEMVTAKDAAVALYAEGADKATRELLYAFVKADEFSWSRQPAREAQDITMTCRLILGGKAKKVPKMTDRNYNTHHDIKKGGAIEAVSELECISGVFLQFYERGGKFTVEAEQDGQWISVGETNGAYLAEWLPLPEGTHRVRLTNAGKNRSMLAELTLYGEGERPARSPQWHTLEKSDIMLLVAHPDDELLWFGGLLPTYAGQRQLAVQVVYMVPATPNRRLELLDGLWHCGVDAYPIFGGLRDAKAYDLKGQYEYWNRAQMLSKVISILRQSKPEVLVTHDVNGEYGHGGHRACADICMQAVTMAGDATKYKPSAAEFGVWQVKKLYLHLYPDNQLHMDWYAPLSAFGGKTGMTVATEALDFHVSQMRNGWGMEEGGDNDNTLLGLQFTTVGPDTGLNDIMENIPQGTSPL